MFTIGTTLAIFAMLGISSVGIFIAKKIDIPHTVLLVIFGIGFGFLSLVPVFSFINEFKLTPELLFYLFLPILIFESAFNISSRRLIENSVPILLLSIIGFLVSSSVIAILLHYILILIGINIPFIITLLFGSLISATDPVAVLTLFKEYGVPRRLSLIFEGESLFNDATSVAFFLIILEAINSGGFTLFTSILGTIDFISMLILGVIYGLLIGGLFTGLIGKTKSSEVANVMLTVVLAHITFITAEIISSHTSIHISPIISTTIASLVIGNYGRAKFNSYTESFVSHLWEHFAFMANSLVFILVGVMMVNEVFLSETIIISVLVTILVVALARAISVYPLIRIYNLFSDTSKHIPNSWQHLMAWGSLRGALAITMVLLIPDDLNIQNWTLEISPKSFLLAITIGCIAATLFIKATTIKSLVRRYNLDNFTPLEEIEYQEAKIIIHKKVSQKLNQYVQRDYISSDIAKSVLDEHKDGYNHALNKINNLSKDERDKLSLRVIRIFAISIEKTNLKSLYEHKEITESVYRRIEGKLKLQLEEIESGNLNPNLTIHTDGKDVIEKFFYSIGKFLGLNNSELSFEEKYMYYRANMIISRKVVKEINILKESANEVFSPYLVDDVLKLYNSFKDSTRAKLEELKKLNPESSSKLDKSLAEHCVKTIEEFELENIFKNTLITPKLYITLRNEISDKV